MSSPLIYDGTKVRKEIEKIEKLFAGSTADERKESVRGAIVFLEDSLRKIDLMKKDLEVLRDLAVSMNNIENALSKK